MTIEEMTAEQIDKIELENFRIREELQYQLQQATNTLAICRGERIKRAQAKKPEDESDRAVS